MAKSLTLIEQHPAVWRGNQSPSLLAKRVPTCIADLDTALSGGFPEWGVIRIRARQGTGELSFLKHLVGQKPADKLITFINAPGHILAPWLKNLGVEPIHCWLIDTTDEFSKWSAEESIRSGACHCVFLWVNNLSPKQARRLQVATEQHHCQVIIYEALSCSRRALPIPLDLSLYATEEGLKVDIHKQQGGWAKDDIYFSFSYTPNNQKLHDMMGRYGSSVTAASTLRG
ncbi:hypothetical protein [Alteromonas sp. C1M14]|uniref:hypothetical protein n=1 Tax=Alteromonas sp. C1M14 TaxID=2841567 RepID=UPI001C09C0E1|nr:hypothetical protein [Alteromonas sp. C1M14]MBU2979827.1 hypothetical protein [Alteromonas sp. C1M14]